MMDLLTYLNTHNENEQQLYFLYRHNYPAFKEWATSKNIDLQASYTDPSGFIENSSLFFWLENMEAY